MMSIFETNFISVFATFFLAVSLLNIDSIFYQATLVLPFFTCLLTGLLT